MKSSFNALSVFTLQFLLERCDFKEPYYGLGFATKVKEELELAIKHKSKVKKSKINVKKLKKQRNAARRAAIEAWKLTYDKVH